MERNALHEGQRSLTLAPEVLVRLHVRVRAASPRVGGGTSSWAGQTSPFSSPPGVPWPPQGAQTLEAHTP